MNTSTPFNHINKVIPVLNLIGSPFNKPQNIPVAQSNSHELYKIAQINKIGLLFLQSLKREQIIGNLEGELGKQTQSYRYQLDTTTRAATILNMIQCKYAVIKSIFPFPAVPGDVDILIFGDYKEYGNAIEIMKANYFESFGEQAPLEESLHDVKNGQKHVDASVKDPFDVDMYKAVGASYIIYMNKAKLINQVTEVIINGTKVSTLKKPSELALSIFHSIFPERIYTLLLHFYILHTVNQMDSADIDEFLQICHEHKIEDAALLAIRLTETIQEISFGESTYKITDVREALGKKKSAEIYTIPYRYPLRVILKSFWHKRNDLEFAMSFLRQAAITLLNPKMRAHVIAEYKTRSKRDTY